MNSASQQTDGGGGLPVESKGNGRGLGPHQSPAFVQFLHLLWQNRQLITAGSLVPVLAAVLLLSAWPRAYTATLVYERPLTESEYNVLLRRFHSQENLARMVGQCHEMGLKHYARKLLGCETERSFEKLIRFTVSPAYPRRLQTTDPVISEKIGALKAQLLSIRMTGRSRQEIAKVATVVTNNIEHILPLYAIRNDLKESVREFQTTAAKIEDNRFRLSKELEREQARLEKLRSLSGTALEADQDRVVLQFTDVKESREFLPLSYQIRAVQAKIIDLQETINGNRDQYDHCIRILEVTNRLLEQVERSLLTQYTVQQFLAFTGEELRACEDEAAADYLRSYIRKTENRVFVNTRAGENPVIYPVPKHVLTRGALVLVVSVLVMVFVAVLLEYQRGCLGGPRGPQG
jgi:hypothetical protein